MPGSKRKRPTSKRPNNNTLKREEPKGTAHRFSTGGYRGVRRGTAGGDQGRKGKAKVVPLPMRRRPRRSAASPARQRGRTERAVGRRRLRLVVGAVAVVCVSLGVRAAQLSLSDDERYRAAFDTEAFASEQEPVENGVGRGPIISADGQRLATSLDAAKVVATPYQVEDSNAMAEALAGILGDKAGDAEEIEKKLTEKNLEGEPGGYSVVAKGIEIEKAKEVEKLGLPGVSVAPDEIRVYPDEALASQLVGFRGTDESYGGVEARYDPVLKSGQEVDLTLDTAVQQELETALEEAAKKYEGKNALGLVMRVEDGAIVAMANSPGYDNNDYGEASEGDKRNRALTDPYEPGSTFKPFTVAAALEEGVISTESTFVVPDAIPVADTIIRDSEEHPTETLNTAGVLQRSRNVGTIQIAQRLGGEDLVERIKRFGFGEGTGVDLWGEDVGVVPPFEKWSGSSIGNIPIGQGLTVTPIQLASGYAALANGGLKVTPYVNEAAAPSESGPRVISGETSSIVRGMLQSVVDEGTGHLAQIPGYTVAGKTGTAQKVDPETGSYGDEYVTSFIGFAPAKVPKYLVMIVVDEPQKALWGEVTAAPAFRRVMNFTLGHFNVPLDRESTKDDPPPADPTPAPDARKEDSIR